MIYWKLLESGGSEKLKSFLPSSPILWCSYISRYLKLIACSILFQDFNVINLRIHYQKIHVANTIVTSNLQARKQKELLLMSDSRLVSLESDGGLNSSPGHYCVMGVPSMGCGRGDWTSLESNLFLQSTSCVSEASGCHKQHFPVSFALRCGQVTEIGMWVWRIRAALS